MNRTRDEAKRFRQRAEKHGGGLRGCSHPSHAGGDNDYGRAIIGPDGVARVKVGGRVKELPPMTPPTPHECTMEHDPSYVTLTDLGLTLPTDPEEGTDPRACGRCSGMRASLSNTGRDAWHEAGHPGDNGLHVGPQDVPQVFRELRP